MEFKVIETINGELKIYAKTLEDEALAQILKMANSPLGENANIRIMPDAHAGKGCVIGTTMRITDKICPNLVGVDIGCGVDLIGTNLDLADNLDKLDMVIREGIPYGMNTHTTSQEWNFEELKCWNKLDKKTQMLAMTSLGTLGGGNHFIEAYADGYIAVHSGSRNIGYKVAEYYQHLAEKQCEENNHKILIEQMKKIEPKHREEWIKKNTINIEKNMSYLTGEYMNDYLHDIDIMQRFANDNRKRMLEIIVEKMGGNIKLHIKSIHNYIDIESMILRKGAISAKQDELLVIPLNMRDGLLICSGKGNADWNYSAPHGAGRLYSRTEAKKKFSVEHYENAMKGIYSSCINANTLDEAPFVYKNYEEIIECIAPTVVIEDRLLPIFNFKAN